MQTKEIKTLSPRGKEDYIKSRLLYAFFRGVVDEPETLKEFNDCIEDLKSKPHKIAILETYFYQTGLEVRQRLNLTPSSSNP